MKPNPKPISPNHSAYKKAAQGALQWTTHNPSESLENPPADPRQSP